MFSNALVLLVSFCVIVETFIHQSDKQSVIIYPKFYTTVLKKHQNLNLNVFHEFDEKIETIELGDIHLELKNNNDIILGENFAPELFQNGPPVSLKAPNCRYLKGVLDKSEIFSVLSVCGEKVTGFLVNFNEFYFIQPLNRSDNAHLLFKHDFLGPHRAKRDLGSVCGTTEFIEVNTTVEEEIQIDEQSDNGRIEEGVTTNLTYNLNQDEDIMGYFYDSAWETHVFKKRRRPKVFAPKRWLEIAIGVDYSVINFHGIDKVQHYILALMNIVSAIYQDPSLESNLQLVITKMFLYDNKKFGQIKEGNARRSLENVNAWNRRLHSSLLPNEPRHDLAIWLTRLDLGGPSGYAPVAGACNPVRSCTLNRDEGLTSAFIIAHEMAHILGLTHDGDKKSGNNCGQEAQEGSVMAPMVAATFNRFSWSTCSKKEFHKSIINWPCLMNPPIGYGEHILKATLHITFTMDEQCRIEFGDGYSQCTSLDMTEPCSHLWCGHYASPLVCKTKKGPPLEGTECGLDKWCINGYCKNVDPQNDKITVDPVIHNSQDGGWGTWSPWQPCSRTCGFGAQFRSRECDNPKPAYGGMDCQGSREDFRICGNGSCPEPLQDFRAEQCKRLNKIIDFENTNKQNMTWLPYEPKEDSLKCQLICQSKENGEIFFTGENFQDGTPCSYDRNNDICIQGDCQKLGCDGSLTVEEIEDSCGICNGDNSQCKKVHTEYQRNLKRETSRVVVLPRLSRNIVVECNISSVREHFDKDIKLHLRDRRKNRYTFADKNEDSIIVKGAKFTFQRFGKYMKILANGPTLAEMIVSLFAPSSAVNSGIGMTIRASYTVAKSNVTKGRRYEWEIGGWGPCSVSCGGGKRQQTVACRDKVTKSLVLKRHCPLTEKPVLMIQDCNIFSCRFRWQEGAWEYCTQTCGNYGIQSRELYCVHHTSNSSEPWKNMVKPDRCSTSSKPESTRACNRVPCPLHWQKNGWSQCSTTCGNGFKIRQYTCPIPGNETMYTCGSKPLDQRRPCKGAHKRRHNPSCRKNKLCHDLSKYCAFTDQLNKYCSLNQYKKVCCKSCLDNNLPK